MKRFTETCKWDDPWFRGLRPNEKLIFLFLVDNCNNAGFYELDIGAIEFKTGISRAEILGAIEGLARGCLGADGWLWIRRFLRHQKNEELNPQNNAHKQIISLIQDQISRFGDFPEFRGCLAPNKGLFSPIGKGKGKGKGKEEGLGETATTAVVEEIYQAYPRKQKRPEGLKAISKALQKYPPDFLLEKTREYARRRAGNLDFVPHPASWFNEEQFNDDPELWEPRHGKPEKTQPYTDMIFK